MELKVLGDYLRLLLDGQTRSFSSILVAFPPGVPLEVKDWQEDQVEINDINRGVLRDWAPINVGQALRACGRGSEPTK